MATRTEADLDDLRQADAKAELVNGEIVYMSPAGGRHWYASSVIAASLNVFVRQHGIRGVGGADNGGFVVNLPTRRTFSPDAAFYSGELTADFLIGAPEFAVEIRSKEDSGPTAERRLAQKRADYFAAGTKVVWDVDLDGEVVVRSYGHVAPETPLEFRRGEQAAAGEALPGWTLLVDELFPEGRH